MTNQATPQQIIEVGRRTIHAEALALKHMEEALGDEFVRAVELILSCRGKLIVTGMGKSGHIARKIAATLASTGTPSFFLHPAEAFHGDLGMISPEDVVLALSYSGETDEILKIVPFIHTNGNPLISMTGNAQSSLARNSDAHLDIMVRKEACILHLAPTSSTTAQLAMIHTVSKGGLGLIVICDEGRIEGIVTDGDIRRAMESRQAEFFNIRAMDIATRNPKCISPEAKLIEAEKKMTQHKVNSLLVAEEGKLLGVIQIYDIKL